MAITWNKIIPRWGGDTIEPPEAKKDTGYIAGDKPPAKWENWLRKGTYEALDETRDAIEGIDSQLAQIVNNVNVALSEVDDLKLSSESTNKIVLRDILRIKMRQTGLNLDANAWSDTLEDATGIDVLNDVVLSSGKLSLKSWDVKYEADALPQNTTPVWTRIPTGTITTESVSNGILSLATPADGTGIAYSRNESSMVASTTKTIKTRAKVITSLSSNVAHGLRFNLNDGVKTANIMFRAEGTVSRFNGTTYVVLASGLPLSSFFVANIMLDNVDGLKIYINDNLIVSVPYTNLPAISSKSIDFTVQGQASAEIDYVYYSLSGSSPTEGTVIWKSVTSESVLSTAVVQAIQSLGTGTIQYFISRDNGNTFESISLDVATDISSQPSGNDIVLKAILTGSAEIDAVAWGGV